MKKRTTTFIHRAAMLLLTMVLTMTSAWAAISGSGTKAEPYVLNDAVDWATFANKDNASIYWGSNVYVKLSDTWDNSSSAVTAMVGTNGFRFGGSFDGNGKTLTLALTTDGNEFTAPFRYVDGATIKLLHTAGNVNGGNQKYATGLIGMSYGTVTITSCCSSVAIASDRSNLGNNQSDATHGGFIGVHEGTVTFTDCLFDGSITDAAATNCGGFVGWRNGTLTFNNCLMAGTMDISSTSGSATFNRNNGEKTTLNHCYYKTSYGDVQGTAIGETSNATLIDNEHLGSGWEISGDDVVPIMNRYDMTRATVSGLKSKYLYDNGNAIAVSYTVTDLGGTQLTADTHFSAVITKGDVTVNSVTDNGEYVLTLTGLAPYTGTKSLNFTVADADLTISSADDWNTFASNVSNGETYSGKYVKLAGNFDNSTPIQRMVGSKEHKFSGTFLGNGKTLNISLSANTDDCAPFLYLDGATIQDLTIAGTITTPAKFGASIAAHTYGTTNITNCTSTVTITSTATSSDDRTHGGFVGVNEGNATLNFTNCVFKGQMLGGNATSCGGFVGWNGGTRINYTDCLFEPTQLTMSAISSSTFNRNGNNALTRCYFTQAFGDEEGKRVYTTAQSDFCNKLVLHGNYYYYVGDAFITTPTRYDYNDGSPITVTPAMTYDGVALNADCYTATFTLDGNSVGTVADKGYYTMTLTGNNSKGYYGSVAVGFRVPWTLENGVDYIDANGVLKNTKTDGIDGNDTPTVLTGNETSLSAGWYVVFGYVGFSSQIRYSGDVHLILADGATMKVGSSNSRIIGNAIDATSYASVFTIYGQSAENNMGTLSIYATVDGDGQKNCINASNLNINGGHIIANTTGDVALYAYNGDITINGGIIEASSNTTGPDYPASILAYNITLNGGTVSAPGIYANTPNCTLTLGGSTVTTNSLYAFRSILKVADGLIYTDGTTTFSGKLCDESDATRGEGKYGTDFNALNTVIKGKTLKAYNGMCGTNVTWSFANETLTISGTGAMEDYESKGSETNQPWRSLDSDIKSVVVEDGVTHIGNSAFEWLNRVKNLTIGKDVETIGDYACKNCSLRVSLIIPPSVTKIGKEAFADNDMLERVYVLPTTVPTLGADAFAVRDDLNTFDILVPSAKEGDYKSAWTAYENIINPFYIITAEPQANMTLTSNNGVQYGSTVYAPNGKINLTMTDPSNPPAGYTATGYKASNNSLEGSGTSYILTILNKDVSITCFTLANYDITYHVNEGATFTTTKNQYTIESDDITLDTPSKDGYTFYGWYENEDLTGDPVTTIYHGSTGAKEFWAKLKKDFTKCTVSVPDQAPYGNLIMYKFERANSGNEVIGESVKDGGTPLTLGTDYEFGSVTFANGNPDPQYVNDECKVEIKGKGEYDGAQWAYFTIVNPGGSGTWGDLSWEVKDGTLTISGTGSMNKTTGQYPWCAYKNFINTITIGENVTSIADGAFATDQTDYHYIVSTVNLPSTLKNIGEYAFAYCTGATIDVPASVTSIGLNAFQEVLKVRAQLSDNADNTDILSELSVAKNNDITLQGRTLWKDGNWNTLCLPFDLEDGDYSDTYIDEFHSGEFGGKDGIVLTGTLLEGCTLMELDVDDSYGTESAPLYTGFDKDKGTLYLYFKNANSIKAGKPYIIKWNNGDNLVNPTFTDVKISEYALKDVTSKDNGDETGFVTFKGTYSSTMFNSEDKSILLLGVNNNQSVLYYPQPKDDKNPSIGGFRAFFQLNNGLQVGNSTTQWTVKSFVLNFGEDRPTLISLPSGREAAGAWYTLDGRKVNAPSLMEGRGGLTPGVYIHKGVKVVIK